MITNLMVVAKHFGGLNLTIKPFVYLGLVPHGGEIARNYTHHLREISSNGIGSQIEDFAAGYTVIGNK